MAGWKKLSGCFGDLCIVEIGGGAIIACSCELRVSYILLACQTYIPCALYSTDLRSNSQQCLSTLTESASASVSLTTCNAIPDNCPLTVQNVGKQIGIGVN
jgi:hypothetical protein